MPRTIPLVRGEGIKEVTFNQFSGLNTLDSVVNLKPGQFSDGRDIVIDGKSFSKRKGHTILGSYSGNTTKVLGHFFFENSTQVQESLRVYDTVVERLVSGIWTALTSVTMTTNKPADGCYFPITDKFYITNGTDAVVKYTSGTSGDQTDSAFKKGRYVTHYKNRLLIALDDILWYTDNGVDTFSASNNVQVEGKITGIETLGENMVLIFTKRKIYRIQNFTFTGNASGPEIMVDLGATFGAIYDSSIVQANGMIYFIGQDDSQKVQVYATNGFRIWPIGIIIQATLNSLSASLLTSSAGGFDGRRVHFSAALSSSSSNDIEVVYDTWLSGSLDEPDKQVWLPLFTNGYSCYAPYEVSGQRSLVAGSPTEGLSFQLSQNEGYEELKDQSYLTGGDADINLAGATSTRVAQGFKLSVPAVEQMAVVGIIWKIKKVSGTTTELTTRIETDSSGVPSGTLADADASKAFDAFTDTTYIYKYFKFTNEVKISGTTQYHAVLQHTTEGSGNSVYAIHVDESSPTYASGSLSTYASGSWTAVAAKDAMFAIVTKSAINGYAVWGSDLGILSRVKKIRRILSMFETGGSYNVQVGVKSVRFSSFTDSPVSLTTGDYAWGASGTTWGSTGPWGGSDVVETWFKPPVSSNQARFFQFRVQNNKPEQHFKHLSTSVDYIVKNKMR